MIKLSPCKINIGLQVIEKRIDGFHNIESIMYPVPLNDIIELNKSETSDFEYSQSGLQVETELSNNLLYKAWKLIHDEYQIGGVKVHLHKQIPMGAGLGGGSSNASSLLKMLNQHYNLALTEHELMQKSAELGSDCPFFIPNKAVFAHQRGTDFKATSLNLSGYYLVIVKAPIAVSTQEAYAGIEPKAAEINLQNITQIPITQWKDNIINQFEHHIFNSYSELETIKEKLYASGAVYAAMSGSGSAIYGLFKDSPTTINFNQKYFYWQGVLS